MVQARIKNFLENCNLEDLINRNKTPHEIRNILLENCKDTNIPKAETIRSYIKEELHLVWDKETKRWAPFDETLEPPKVRKERGKYKKKVSSLKEEFLVLKSDLEFQDEKDKNLDIDKEDEEEIKIEEITDSPPIVIENEEKSNMGVEPKNMNVEYITKGDKIGTIKNTNKENLLTFDFDNMPTSDYLKHILAAGSEKISISLNIFISALFDYTMFRDFHIKFRNNKSKAIEVALAEFLTEKNRK